MLDFAIVILATTAAHILMIGSGPIRCPQITVPAGIHVRLAGATLRGTRPMGTYVCHGQVLNPMEALEYRVYWFLKIRY